MKSHAFDPTDLQICEFFFKGAPNPKDLEGVDKDWLLAIQKTILNAERERNITKEIQEYEQKYDFINKAL